MTKYVHLTYTLVDGAGYETLTAAGVSLETYPALTHLVRAENAHVWPSESDDGREGTI